MTPNVENNFKKLRPILFSFPCVFLLAILLFFYQATALNAQSYVQIQKDLFYFLNANLSQFPQTIYNLTQFGDALVFLSVLTVFFVRYPKLWEALLSASILSGVLASMLKAIFSVPRPAAALDQSTFVIIGKVLNSTTNSLPSGHSITVFTILTVLMFGFMPTKATSKILWFALCIISGLLLASTRVGVGAHFPTDVLVGCIVGYISGLSGIFINRKYNIWKWIGMRKYYPIFIILFAICSLILAIKIYQENLFVFYLSLIAVLYSLIQITKTYVQK